MRVLISPCRRKKASVRSSERAGDEHVLAVSAEQRLAHEQRQPVVHQRSEHAAQGPGRDRQNAVHLALGGEVPGRRHDQLARQRKHRRFDGHQDHDPGVAEGENGVRQPVKEAREHAVVRLFGEAELAQQRHEAHVGDGAGPHLIAHAARPG